MVKAKVTHKRKESKDKDILELNRLILALKATEHNPVGWAAIFSVVAPILGRLAARYAAVYLASKWNKRATPKIRAEVAQEVADRIITVFKSIPK